MKFPALDQKQVRRQLALLGHSPDSPVYLRFFYPSDDPRKDGDKGRKADRLNPKEIEAYQSQGRGAYFVVNGGGHKNDDVVKGRAIFIEHDDLDKDTQKQLWKILELPEPTFQVDTGGKSIHSYWVLTEAIAIEKWCQLQRDLLEYGDGDRSIKNPARVMRLAGAWHISHDEKGHPVYNQSRIITDSGFVYSFEELRGLIPETEKERLPLRETAMPSKKMTAEPNTEDQLPRHPDQISLPVPAAVPLLECCRIQVRTWVTQGVPKGSGRNDTAINIGLELIAVERYLQSIGQSYTDSARSLFSEFCRRSLLTNFETEERYKWCEQKNPTPSCGEDGIAACIKGWYWRSVVKPQLSGGKQSPQEKKVNTQTPDGAKSQTDQESLPLNEAVKQILESFSQESLRMVALLEIAQRWGYPARNIELLARVISREGQVDEEVAIAVASLSGHLKLHQKRLDLTKHLEANLSGLLVDAANALPTAPEYLFNSLLSPVASCVGTSSRLVVNPSGGYVQPLIFWTGNVAHSGQAKTPPQQIILQPLFEMESSANEIYEGQKAEYELDKSGNVPPPTRQRYILSNTTMSTKIRIMGENKRGLLEYSDELASDFRRLNQYKKGVGDDLEQELSFYNGGSILYDRSDARIFVERTGNSKMGTLQWDTLGDLMAQPGFINSGYMARLLLCTIGDAPARYLDLFNESDAVVKLQALLGPLYEQMRQLPERDYLLSHEAKVQGIEVLIERLVNQVVALVRSLENIKARPFEVAIIHLSPVG